MSSGAKKIIMGAGSAGGGAGTTVAVSPAWDSKTSWDLASGADGDLNFFTSSAGTSLSYTVTPDSAMTCVVKMWGGAGSYGWYYGYNFVGPYQTFGNGGGALVATVAMSAGQDYIVRVGAGGIARGGAIAGATFDYGGVQVSHGSTGGGYSGIFLGSLSHVNAYLMAGGGGGGSSSGFGLGGAGGGTNGQSTSGGLQGGNGGSQSGGGSPSIYNSSEAGAALYGGRGHNYGLASSQGGGGSGYYGGGGGNVGGGGGGSGFSKGDSTLSSVTLYTGDRAVPGNSSDSDRGSSGYGTSGTGQNGRIIFQLVP